MFRPSYTGNTLHSSPSGAERRSKHSNTSSDPGSFKLSRVFGAGLHVKYIAIVKQVAVLLYVLRSIHANLELDVLCYDTDEVAVGEKPKLKICLRPSCMWLHWLILRLPRWLVHDLPEAVCTSLLFFVLLSSLMMLCALYLRELEHRMISSTPRWVRVIIILPGVLVELLFALLMSYSIFVGALHWSNFNVPRSSVVLAVIYAVILAVFVLVQLALHLAAVAYICRSTDMGNSNGHEIIDYGFDTCTTDTPTAAVLAMLKYQAESERLAVMSPPDLPSPYPISSAENSARRKSLLASFDLSQVNNNDLMLSHGRNSSPNKAPAMESPPYARLRPPLFNYGISAFCDTDISSAQCSPRDLNRSIRSDYTRNHDMSKRSRAVSGDRLLSTSLNEYTNFE